MDTRADAADLVTRARALPPDTPMSYRTPGLEGFDTTRSALWALRYEPDHMDEQFSHAAFDLLRNDPTYGARFEACRSVFVSREDRERT